MASCNNIRALRYDGLKPASKTASSAARGASRKIDTKPELLLRRALWQIGLRYRKNVENLPGKPDVVFPKQRLAVFCDGDFWHGRNWSNRRAKLKSGHNASYWIAKIERNMRRDAEQNQVLKEKGWKVLRIWEHDIKTKLNVVIEKIVGIL